MYVISMRFLNLGPWEGFSARRGGLFLKRGAKIFPYVWFASKCVLQILYRITIITVFYANTIYSVDIYRFASRMITRGGVSPSSSAVNVDRLHAGSEHRTLHHLSCRSRDWLIWTATQWVIVRKGDRGPWHVRRCYPVSR